MQSKILFIRFVLHLFFSCNDVLELVQTIRHFQILSKTVSIGGADNQTMDILTQEVHAKYQTALTEFQSNVKDVMNLDNQTEKFETCFFHLRTTVKVNFQFSKKSILKLVLNSSY